MTKYIMRLDDACEKMDIEKWSKMEELLDKYGIKALVGIIPNCEDSQMDKYSYDSNFWEKVDRWIAKDWTVAMHGYNHVYSTACGGINPVNKRSEFAGESLETQKEKVRLGFSVFNAHGIEPKVFFAPSHTFDENTLLALEAESNIRIISDTVSNDIYCKNGFTFVPQQTGRVRRLPFKTVTCCYHPNVMNCSDFEHLEAFFAKYGNLFTAFPINASIRKKSFADNFVSFLYFAKRKIKR